MILEKITSKYINYITVRNYDKKQKIYWTRLYCKIFIK